MCTFLFSFFLKVFPFQVIGVVRTCPTAPVTTDSTLATISYENSNKGNVAREVLRLTARLQYRVVVNCEPRDSLRQYDKLQ